MYHVFAFARAGVRAFVQLNGLLECGRSTKVEGSFAGNLVSTGDIVVAPTGKIAGDLKGLKFLLVEGQVISVVFFFHYCCQVYCGARRDLWGPRVYILYALFDFSQAVSCVLGDCMIGPVHFSAAQEYFELLIFVFVRYLKNLK